MGVSDHLLKHKLFYKVRSLKSGLILLYDFLDDYMHTLKNVLCILNFEILKFNCMQSYF